MTPTIVLQNLPSGEYVQNPSLRTVDAFFLGGVFLLSLAYVFKAPAIQSLTYSIENMLQRQSIPSSLEALEAGDHEKERLRKWIEDVLLGPAESLDPKNLVFVLCIFVANASLAMFGSTLIFFEGQDTMCTFLVAWGGLSAEMIRVIGFIRLSIELKFLHTHRWEMYLTWFYLVIVIAFMLFNNAVESGVLRSATNIDGIYLCYRQYSLLTSLLSSLTNFIFECYALLRLTFLLAPPFLKGLHRWGALKDIRIGMAMSLLLMDVLTVVPNAIPVSIAADFIPFSIAALIVLVVFNRHQDLASSTLSRVDSIPSTRMMEISRRDYDANSIVVRTPNTARSRSVIQRRSSSVSRAGRYSRRSQLPHFSLGALSGDGSARRKRAPQDLVITIGHSSPGTTPATPKSSSEESFASQETIAHGQVMTAQRAVRLWPILPPGQRQERRASRPQSTLFNGIPHPPVVPPPLPPVPTPRSQPEDRAVLPGSAERRRHTATPSVVSGSGKIQRKRAYDPARNFVEPNDQRRRSNASTFVSPSRDEVSTASGWPRAEGDRHTSPTNVSSHRNGAALRWDVEPARPNVRRRDISGAAAKRYGVACSLIYSEQNWRSSFDLAAGVPNIPSNYEPASPSTAPVSRTSIVPVVSPLILSPPLVDPYTQRDAVATGVARGVDGRNSTRVRFGARPMRSAVLSEGFREPEEDVMPRGYLEKQQRGGYDKYL